MVKVGQVFGKEAEGAIGRATVLVKEAVAEFKGKVPTRKDIINRAIPVTLLSGGVGAAVLHATPAGSPQMVEAMLHATHFAQHAPAMVTHAIEAGSHLAPAVASAMTTATAMVASKGVEVYHDMMNTGFGRLARASVAAAIHHAPLEAQELKASSSRLDRWAGRRIEALQASAGNVHGVEQIAGVAKDVTITAKHLMHPPEDSAAMLSVRQSALGVKSAYKEGMSKLRADIPVAETSLTEPKSRGALRTFLKIKNGAGKLAGALKRGALDAWQHAVTLDERIPAMPVTGFKEAVEKQIPAMHEGRAQLRKGLGPYADKLIEPHFSTVTAKAPIAAEMADGIASNGAHLVRVGRQEIVEPHIVKATKALEDIMAKPELER